MESKRSGLWRMMREARWSKVWIETWLAIWITGKCGMTTFSLKNLTLQLCLREMKKWMSKGSNRIKSARCLMWSLELKGRTFLANSSGPVYFLGYAKSPLPNPKRQSERSRINDIYYTLNVIHLQFRFFTKKYPKRFPLKHHFFCVFVFNDDTLWNVFSNHKI